MCNDGVVEYIRRRRSELSSAPLDIEYDNNKYHRDKAIAEH